MGDVRTTPGVIKSLTRSGHFGNTEGELKSAKSQIFVFSEKIRYLKNVPDKISNNEAVFRFLIWDTVRLLQNVKYGHFS